MDHTNFKVSLYKIQNITYTKSSKFLLYGYCVCLIYFINLKLNKNDREYINFYQIFVTQNH